MFSGAAYAAEISRDKIVAAFIFQLVENIYWADEAEIKKYRIHLVDSSPKVTEQLTQIAEVKQMHERPFEVSRSNDSGIPNDAHVVYISSDNVARYSKIFDQTKGRNVLLISDELVDQRKVMINLRYREDKKLRFEINKANILNQNLMISPDIILLGGTEIDVAKLYRETQTQLEEQEQELASRGREIASKDQDIASRDRELASKDRELDSREQELASLDVELKSLGKILTQTRQKSHALAQKIQDQKNKFEKQQSLSDSV